MAPQYHGWGASPWPPCRSSALAQVCPCTNLAALRRQMCIGSTRRRSRRRGREERLLAGLSLRWMCFPQGFASVSICTGEGPPGSSVSCSHSAHRFAVLCSTQAAHLCVGRQIHCQREREVLQARDANEAGALLRPGALGVPGGAGHWHALCVRLTAHLARRRAITRPGRHPARGESICTIAAWAPVITQLVPGRGGVRCGRGVLTTTRGCWGCCSCLALWVHTGPVLAPHSSHTLIQALHLLVFSGSNP